MIPAQIFQIYVSDFKLAALRRREICRNLHRLIVIKINAGDYVIAFRMARLLFNRNSPSILVKLYHAEWSRIFDPVAEYRCTVLLLCALTEHFTQRIAVEDVIAQHKAYRVVAHKLSTDQKCVRNTTRDRLFCIANLNAELTSIAEQRAECICLVRRNDHHDIGNARLHKNCKRVINHRLIVNRKQRLAHRFCHRVKARAFAGG